MTIENANENLANAIGAGIEQLIKSNITSVNTGSYDDLPNHIQDHVSEMLHEMIYERVHEVVEDMIDDRISEAIDACLTDKLNDLTITFE